MYAESREASTWPEASEVSIGSKLWAVISSGTATPAAYKNVGTKSMRLTKSSTLPAAGRGGQQIAKGTRLP